MHKNRVEDVVTGILHDALQLEEGFAVSNATRLVDIPNMDSLGRVRLVIEIEKVIADRLSMDEIISLESVGQIRLLLAAKGKVSIEGKDGDAAFAPPDDCQSLS